MNQTNTWIAIGAISLAALAGGWAAVMATRPSVPPIATTPIVSASPLPPPTVMPTLTPTAIATPTPIISPTTAAKPTATNSGKPGETGDPQCRSYFRQVVTTGGTATVRAEDGTEKSIAPGTLVLFSLGAARGNRSEIQIPGGFTGWVDDRNLTDAQVGSSQFTGKMLVKTLDGGSVNLRDRDATSGRVVGSLPNGSEVTTVKAQKEGYWWQVTSANGLRGYVADKYLICK